jgi:hypothetical protein
MPACPSEDVFTFNLFHTITLQKFLSRNAIYNDNAATKYITVQQKTEVHFRQL